MLFGKDWHGIRLVRSGFRTAGMHIHMHMCTYNDSIMTHMHITCIVIHTQKYTHVRMHTQAADTYTHTCLSVCVYMCVCLYVCTCVVCVLLCMCVTHTYNNTHTCIQID